MASDSVAVYTGLWTDQSKGPIIGATLTLKTQSGVLLLAAVASFVTVVATCLWRVCRFALHQTLADDKIHDGLYFQRQSVLRNSQSPFAAAVTSFQQLWYCGGTAHKVHRRTIPTAVISLAYVAVFLVVAIFSAKVSDAAGPYRLVRSEEAKCGIGLDIASPSPDTPLDDLPLEDKEEALRADIVRERTRNRNADVYAAECYQDNPKDSRGRCNLLPVPSLPWGKTTIPCPFGDLCIDGSALRLESELLDSGTHLGVNQPRKHQIQYRKRTECAPLKLRFTEDEALTWIDNETNATVERCLDISLYYGPVVNASNGIIVNNHTYKVLTCSHIAGVSQFTADSVSALEIPLDCPICNNEKSPWQPLAALVPTNRDVTLLFVFSNAVRHTAPNKDLIFGASELDSTAVGSGSSKFYRPQNPFGVLACAESHQICNSATEKCSDLMSAGVLFNKLGHADMTKELDLNAAQTAAAFVLAAFVVATGMYHLVYTRLGSFLKAQTGSSEFAQVELSDNQWEVESGALFTTGLARFQHEMLDFAGGGSPTIPEGLVMSQPWKDERWLSSFAGVSLAADQLAELCHSQKARNTDGTLSFSVLGLGIIFGLGGFILLLSLVIEPLTGYVQKTTGRGITRGAAWERDGNLQMQRLLFEERGQGEWIGTSDSVPRTKNRTSLRFPAEIESETERKMRVQRFSHSGQESGAMFSYWNDATQFQLGNNSTQLT